MKRTAQAIANARRQSAEGPKYAKGMCKKAVREAYGVESDGSEDATEAWERADLKHDVRPGREIPRGALIWWTGGTGGHGHVAISLGGGMCLSTDILRNGYFDQVPVASIATTWPKVTLAGWSEDIDGVRVWEPPHPDATSVATIAANKRATDPERARKWSRIQRLAEALGGVVL